MHDLLALLARPGKLPYHRLMRDFEPSIDLDSLSTPQKLSLLRDVLASIRADIESEPLTRDQRAEIQRRLDHLEENPDDVMEWEHVKASILRER